MNTIFEGVKHETAEATEERNDLLNAAQEIWNSKTFYVLIAMMIIVLSITTATSIYLLHSTENIQKAMQELITIVSMF